MTIYRVEIKLKTVDPEGTSELEMNGKVCYIKYFVGNSFIHAVNQTMYFIARTLVTPRDHIFDIDKIVRLNDEEILEYMITDVIIKGIK